MFNRFAIIQFEPSGTVPISILYFCSLDEISPARQQHKNQKS